MATNDTENGDLQNVLKVSAEVRMTLAYTGDKLANLEVLLSHVVADIEPASFEGDDISPEFIEKAFTFDILYSILNFELRELETLFDDLRDLTVDALGKISSFENPIELVTDVARKLRDSESVLKRSQDRILEIKIRLAKLQLTSFIFNQNKYKHDWEKGVKVELRLETTERRPQTLTVEQRRVLRMLEISLAREVELEKKLTDVEQNEQDLKSKIRLMEQVAVCMEETAEVAWGRFLEADNRAEVLMAVSKEILGKLKTVTFCLTSSTKREEEIKYKLEECIKQLNEKDTSIQKLNSTIAELITDNSEVTMLRERVRKLEENLIKSESQLDEANTFGERSQEQIKLMESEIESLRENLYAAEDKVTHLTDTNVELTEELEFLKGSNESNSKKVSVLEKQLRESDSQLQHSRQSSEASLEQQTMLYSAIWDMETLIDELRQKVANAESKMEITQEQCVMLSETNSDLNKELDFLRSRIDQATLQKRLSAEDINIRTSLIMDTVMQLAVERERIQKKLASLSKENKLLSQKLQKQQKSCEILSSGDEALSAKASEIEVEKLPMDKDCSSLNENEIEPDLSGSVELRVPKSRRMYIFMVIPILAAYVWLTLIQS